MSYSLRRGIDASKLSNLLRSSELSEAKGQFSFVDLPLLLLTRRFLHIRRQPNRGRLAKGRAGRNVKNYFPDGLDKGLRD